MAEKFGPQERYQAKNRVNVTLAFMKSTEQDLLDHLSKQDNKAGYIKSLIRADMAKNNDN
ncbi:MAG: hypothetical protein MJ094_01180 [Saccharofermentans sp.]|nr:hypothetical protein [Saccharofermentans sp.]